MKTKNLTSPLIAGILGASTILSFSEKPKDQSSTASDRSAEHARIVRISEAEVRNLLTVRDLIGKFVVDDAGEKFGFVSNISFGTSMPTLPESHYDRTGPLDLPPSPDSKTQSPAPLPKIYDTRKEQGVTEGQSIMDEIRLYAYISVGGFLGLGDDLVRVALSELIQDKEKDQLILEGISKSNIKAIAESGKLNYGNTAPQESARNTSAALSQTVRNAGVTQQIVEALRENAMIPDEVAEKITVTELDNNLVLEGTVDSFRLKILVGRIATEISNLPVINQIVVE